MNPFLKQQKKKRFVLEAQLFSSSKGVGHASADTPSSSRISAEIATKEHAHLARVSHTQQRSALDRGSHSGKISCISRLPVRVFVKPNLVLS